MSDCLRLKLSAMQLANSYCLNFVAEVKHSSSFHFAQGIEIIDDISDSQVEACAGGPVLRTEVIDFALQKNSKHIHRSIQALLQALEEVRRPKPVCSLRYRKVLLALK